MPKVSHIYCVFLEDISILLQNELMFFLFQLDEEKLDDRAKMSVAAKRSLFRVRGPIFFFWSIFLIKT